VNDAAVFFEATKKRLLLIKSYLHGDGLFYHIVRDWNRSLPT
jgi:hypothetical protein